MVEFSVEIDADLYDEVKSIFAPQGITPEQLIEQFIRFCADPQTQEQAKEMLRQWKREYDAMELYKAGGASLGKCAEMAGMDKTDFIRYLGLWKVSILEAETHS